MSSPIRRSLPLRGQAENARPTGPKPFSREWHNLPPERKVPAPKRRLGVPAWLPSERALTIAVVALLVLASSIIQTGWAPNVAGSGNGDPGDGAIVAGAGHLVAPTATATSAVVPAVATEAPDEPATTETTDQAAVTETTAPAEPTAPTDEGGDQDEDISLGGQGAAGQVDDETTEASDDKRSNDEGESDGEMPEDPDATARTEAMEGAILPHYRILAYYGHPADERMGILGQFEMEELLAQLLDEAATYNAADPERPVMPAFELIASVAQGDPMSDGSWLGRTDHETIMEYVEFTEEKGILLILDIQIGYTSVQEDMAMVEEYLRYPHVHLAIDPEFSLEEPDIPGQVIGGVDAEEVTYAQERLVEICAEEGIPPKVLIVHRFRHEMIRDDDKVKPVEGVQLVIDMDGFGHPGLKIDSYTIFITDKDPEYAGIKVFYDQDVPVMTAEEVLDLGPPPDYIMYQ